jgi:UDPglucose 6-dehydrogenase
MVRVKKTVLKDAEKPLIGFVGQGFVGKNYADDFEKRGYTTVRYALEEPYRENKDTIKTCDIVFVCVPTPTTPKGFDLTIVESGLRLVGKGKIAVIKSTMSPGTTRMLQEKHPHITVLCSPEFLSVATAAHDAAHPFSNIVGMPGKTVKYKKAADAVHAVLPYAPFTHTCTTEEAELIKYTHNISGYMQILTFNLFYDMAQSYGADWSAIQKAVEADPMISNRYSNPVHKSGRGAGGACFIKDFAAFAKLYKKTVGTKEGIAFLEAAEKENIMLLLGTNKDLDLLAGVYGSQVLKRGGKSVASVSKSGKKSRR